MPKGGKGDTKSAQIKLPKEIEALAKRNLGAAEAAGRIGYVPYQGPTVAALNPMQINSMQQNANAMKAFGMQPAGVTASIPKAKTYAGGIQGYDPMALYNQAKGRIAPHQLAQIGTFTNQPGQVNPDGTLRGAAAGRAGGGAGGKGGQPGGGPMYLDKNTGQSMMMAQPGSFDPTLFAKGRKLPGGK